MLQAGANLEDLARAMASLRGPNIVAEFDVGRDRGEMTTGIFVQHILDAEIIV